MTHTPPRVLVVDDEPAIAATLRIRLEAAGYDVDVAPTGSLGLEAAAQLLPDAIILDVRLPDISGFEVCRLIRSAENLQSIPILFLSANVREEARREAMDAGGDRFFSKPYEPQEVLATIERFTQRGQSLAA